MALLTIFGRVVTLQDLGTVAVIAHTAQRSYDLLVSLCLAYVSVGSQQFVRHASRIVIVRHSRCRLGYCTQASDTL